jgi:hypothetical protein
LQPRAADFRSATWAKQFTLNKTPSVSGPVNWIPIFFPTARPGIPPTFRLSERSPNEPTRIVGYTKRNVRTTHIAAFIVAMLDR